MSETVSSDYETKTPTSIAWVRQHVDQRIMQICGLLGLVKLVEVQGRKISALETKLAKTATTGKRK